MKNETKRLEVQIPSETKERLNQIRLKNKVYSNKLNLGIYTDLAIRRFIEDLENGEIDIKELMDKYGYA